MSSPLSRLEVAFKSRPNNGTRNNTIIEFWWYLRIFQQSMHEFPTFSWLSTSILSHWYFRAMRTCDLCATPRSFLFWSFSTHLWEEKDFSRMPIQQGGGDMDDGYVKIKAFYDGLVDCKYQSKPLVDSWMYLTGTRDIPVLCQISPLMLFYKKSDDCCRLIRSVTLQSNGLTKKVSRAFIVLQ